MKKTLTNEETEKKSLLDSLVKFDAKEAKKKEWIIPHVIPRGGLTLIAGREQCGKTTLLMQLCVDLGAGRKTLLDGDDFEGRKPMRIIYLDAEECEEDVVERFHELGVKGDVVGLDKSNPAAASITTASDGLREIIAGYRPDLVVLAPISSFLPERCKATSKKDVVHALRPLIELSNEFHCGMVILQHTNKTESTDYRKCISDSSYFSEAPRSIIMMSKTQRQGEVFCSVEKGSMTSVYEPYETRLLQFRRDRQELEFVGTTKKQWRDFVLQAQGRDVADANKSASAFERKTKMQDTMDAIVKALEESKQLKRDELLNAALDNGGSAGMFERARKQLVSEGIITTQAMRGDGRVTYMVYSLATDEPEVEDVFGVKGGAA